ncbi:spore coat protein [Thermincola potens]|uniref:Coat F domain protein n=1 Tax=Thermincola potens (strain JR) TaxID=635013 RepID=D5X7I4_THEPJ|nr:spore coat protein [Thermincola potens]ADG82554.1 Coat F domain protein [Thermincola potens JR]
MQQFGSPQFGAQQPGAQAYGTQQMGIGQPGWQTPQQGQAAQFGAHEIMEVHEVLSSLIEGINRFQLYKPYIKDQQLNSMMDSHLSHMNRTYDQIASYLHSKGAISFMPYHGVKKTPVQYGLRNPSPMQPSSSVNDIDDRDVALGMLAYHKSSALKCTMAALECADYNLRQLMQNCSVSCMNQAWECFTYMNQRGMYQVPTMQQNTTNTMVNSYQMQ